MKLNRHLRATLVGGASLAVVAMGALIAPASAADKIVLNAGEDPAYVEQGVTGEYSVELTNAKQGDRFTVTFEGIPKGVQIDTDAPACKQVKSANPLTFNCEALLDGDTFDFFDITVAENAPKGTTTVTVVDETNGNTASAEIRTGALVDYDTFTAFPQRVTPDGKNRIKGGLKIEVWNNGPQTSPVKVTVTADKNARFIGAPTDEHVKSCSTVSETKVVCTMVNISLTTPTPITIPTKFTPGKFHNFTATFTAVGAWDTHAKNNQVQAKYTADINPEPTPTPTTAPTTAPTTTPTTAPTTQPTQEPTTQPTQEPTTQPTRQPTTQPTQEPTTTAPSSTQSVPTKVPAGLSDGGTDSGAGPGAWGYGGVAAGLMALLVLAGAFLRRRGSHQA